MLSYIVPDSVEDIVDVRDLGEAERIVGTERRVGSVKVCCFHFGEFVLLENR